ncbi:hypothetical protein SprV_0602167400 [Sparganum proliferum]
MDTLKSSLKPLQINPTSLEGLALDRPTWRRTVKRGAAIYEANRIAAAKVKREARKSQLRPARNADAQPRPTCPLCQRIFWARIGLIGHLRINRTSRTAPTAVPPSASSSSSSPPTSSAYTAPPLLTTTTTSSSPSSSSLSSSSLSSSFSFSSSSSSSSSSSHNSSSSSSSSALTTAALADVAIISITHIPDTNTDTSPPTSDSSIEDQDYTCPHCDRTFTSHIGLVGHF